MSLVNASWRWGGWTGGKTGRRGGKLFVFFFSLFPSVGESRRLILIYGNFCTHLGTPNLGPGFTGCMTRVRKLA